uniref:C2H2-type domain-containing protein n=1 Tax=Maylandia zebra TaxID=106582 RepID=A0A3P9D0V9_9CICH
MFVDLFDPTNGDSFSLFHDCISLTASVCISVTAGPTWSKKSVLSGGRQTSQKKGKEKIHCDICGKTFRWLVSRNIHQRLHTGEKPYKCRHCDKCFSHSSRCNDHEDTHIEGNFICDQCDKSFKNLISYSEHKRYHAANKQFHCYQCAKTFTSLSALCKHQRDHETG